jgi:hypothetical protein
MAAVALDSIDYAHQLEAAGMPRQQAELVAKGLTIMLVHNFDTLVTKDYLDTRFSEFETRIDAKIEKRFVGVDKQFVSIDKRFTAIDKRFTAIDKQFSKIDMQFVELRADMRGEIGDIRGTLKLHSWMFAVLIAGVFITKQKRLVA